MAVTLRIQYRMKTQKRPGQAQDLNVSGRHSGGPLAGSKSNVDPNKWKKKKPPFPFHRAWVFGYLLSSPTLLTLCCVTLGCDGMTGSLFCLEVISAPLVLTLKAQIWTWERTRRATSYTYLPGSPLVCGLPWNFLITRGHYMSLLCQLPSLLDTHLSLTKIE